MEPVSGILFTLFRGTPQHGEWMLSCLEGAWPGLVGDNIARVCQPVRFDKSRLTIQILDPAWEEPLKAMKPELLGRLRHASSDQIHDLDFTVR
jgi:hypothetical protein